MKTTPAQDALITGLDAATTPDAILTIAIAARGEIPALVVRVEQSGLDEAPVAYAMIWIEPEDRAIALSYVSAESDGNFTEDGYGMAEEPYTPAVRSALLKAARAALSLV